MAMRSHWTNYLPAVRWLKDYNLHTLKSDFLAALIVTALLIPQGLAYALIAGLPPIMGLYASIFPIMLYAFLGGSSTLSIGPVAILSMMTFAFLQPLFPLGSDEYIQAACLLTLMVGLISIILGLLRFGFLIQLISHPVIQGFIIAASLLIALGQVRFILDIPVKSDNLIEFIRSIWLFFPHLSWITLFVGLISLVFLAKFPQLLKTYLPSWASFAKISPLLLVIIAILLNNGFTVSELKTVGEIPSGLPTLTMPIWSWELVQTLLLPAFLIAMINFIESLSIAEATALQKRQSLNANQELIAMGVSNLGSGFSMGFPVGGSLSRTVVNADAGAKTPFVGLFVGSSIIIISLFFTTVFYHLPLAILAATIIISITKLIKIRPFIDTFRYSKIDGIAMLITFFAVVLIDVATGLTIGVISTFVLLLWKMSRPHLAVIGLIHGTEHFRNVERHKVITCPEVLALRIDEKLTFLNAHPIKAFIINKVNEQPLLQHVIINCSGISDIDYSALEMLEEINQDLLKLNINLHLSEVKGPVMDQLQHSHFLTDLTGEIFLSHYQAMQQLSPQLFSKSADTAN